MRITRFIPSVLFGEKRFDDLNELSIDSPP